MKILSDRIIALLFPFSMNTMEERYNHCVENLYVNETQEIYEFCKWIDKNIGGCSKHNIKMLFRAFKNPNDKIAQTEARLLKEKITKIKKLL